MSRTCFEIFCEIIDEGDPLSTQTAMSFYHKLKIECLPEVKSEISKKLIDIDTKSRIEYLEYILLEIDKQNYVKNAELWYISKHLEEYNVKLEDILNFNLNNLPHKFRFQVLDIHYMDMKPYSKEKDTAFLVQTDFMNYLCKVTVDELIEFCNSKIESYRVNTIDGKSTGIKNELLENFHTYSGLDNSEMYELAYHQYKQQNLDKAILLLDKEIKNNLLLLENNKLKIYFDQIIEMLKKSQFLNFDNSKMNIYVNQYDLDLSIFPKVQNSDLNKLLRLTGDPFNPLNGKDYKIYFEAERVQTDFYRFTAKLEINKYIDKVKQLETKYLKVDKPKEEKKHSYVKLYAYNLSKYDSLAIEHNYFTYYNHILLSYISNVKEEVEERVLKLSAIKIPLFLKRTIAEIENSGFQNSSPTAIDKYVKKYNIDADKLPEINNQKFKEILSTKDYYQTLPYEEFSEIEFIQEQFYLFALRVETIKLLKYFRELQSDYLKPENSKVEVSTKYNSNIFLSKKAEQWFIDTLKELNAIDEDNIAKKGFQAKASAINSNVDCRKVIFKYGFLLKDYITYLKKEFSADIPNKDKLSNGRNHEPKVEELIEIYQNS